MKITILKLSIIGVLFSLFDVYATHPQILTTNGERKAIREKIENSLWAKESYDILKNRVKPYIEYCQNDPNWLRSRLMMNWQTHYTTDVCEKSRWVRGKGYAPVPTPRFAGARDWVSKYKAPSGIEDFKPYNDNNGKVWLVNGETQKGQWVDSGLTGRVMEYMNDRIVSLAADAAFIYWLEGDEAYAKLAGDVLWDYMYGFSFKRSPEFPPDDEGMAKIIGMTSFEVIHEDIVTPLSLCYDFLYGYLTKQGRDVSLIQTQLKRMIDRVIEGGFAEGNWNLNQARIIAFGGLSLEDNAVYSDGKGRPYYVDIVLNAQLKTQRGLIHVIKEGYDLDTALWPEAPGYGFGTTADIVRMASLMAADSNGRNVLDDPILTRAVLAQLELIYPNGLSCGVGDTDNTRINTIALELLITRAREKSDIATEAKLTAALQHEIDTGYYDRGRQPNLLALTKYVGKLKPVTEQTATVSRTFWAAPLNTMMQRNVASDAAHSLAAAMFATDGGHIHSNGLAIELYGAGAILGADPGRGSSYWQPDHGEYYSRPPAHNTVIINGATDYPAYGDRRIIMRPDFAEPKPGSNPISPNISVAQGSVQYTDPPAKQQRVLALIRTGEQSGFYFDVFRSHTKGENSFHDYLYHNIGQSLKVASLSGNSLQLVKSERLGSGHGNLKGYDYFKNEESIETADDLRGIFSTEIPDGTQCNMDIWMPGRNDRQIFRVDAPGNRAARRTPTRGFVDLPMPTLLVRQQGDAWTNPFIAVFEPYLGAEGPTIRMVRVPELETADTGLAACVVESHKDVYTVCLVQDDAGTRPHQIDDYRFQGRFGVIMLKNKNVSELYLADGTVIGDAHLYIASEDNAKVNASVIRQTGGWCCSSSAPINVQLEFPMSSKDVSAGNLTIRCQSDLKQIDLEKIQVRIEKRRNENVIMANCLLPAGYDHCLSIDQIKE